MLGGEAEVGVDREIRIQKIGLAIKQLVARCDAIGDIWYRAE